MNQPSLCMISETVGTHNAIGKIAAAEVRAALDAGFRVSVVAHRLEAPLRDRVEWLKLYNPPRGFAVKWLTARRFVKRALGGHRFDVVHGHQPQIADLCDVFQCHFLTRVAHERGCLVSGSGLGSRLRRWQQRAVLAAEDRCYRRWSPGTRLLLVSDLISREFDRLYGLPAGAEVLENAAPPWQPIDEPERLAARQHFGLHEETRPVVGYLGGLQRRKGYDRLLDAAADAPGLRVLMGGQQTGGLLDPRLTGRLTAIGLTEPQRFLAACDVLVVPSRFDPCPVLVLEAASRGVPVIATEGVGNLATLLACDAGVAWGDAEPLAALVGMIMGQRDRFVEGCRRLTERHSQAGYLQRLLTIYDEHLSRSTGAASTPARGPRVSSEAKQDALRAAY